MRSATLLDPYGNVHTRSLRRRRRTSGAGVVLPVGLVAGAVGAVAADNPLAAAGVTGVTILAFVPWVALFTTLIGSAIANRWGVEVSGVSLRMAQAVLIPFCLRAVLFTDPDVRPRWRFAEWVLIMFVVVNFISTYFFAPVNSSWLAAGIELLGATAYLAVYMSVCTPQRLRVASRIFLSLGAVSAAIGIASFLGYYVGFGFGVDYRYVPAINGAPAIKGIAYEHDIFGSTCAAVAIALLVLMREHSTLFSKKWTERLFWISLGGMLVSQARGAWIGFGFIFILYYVVGVRRRRVVRVPKMLRTTAVVFLLGLMGLVGFYLTNTQNATSAPSPLNGLVTTVYQKVQSGLSLSGNASCDGCNTGAGRIRRWTKGIDEVTAQSPVIGLGTDSYGLRNFRPSPHTWPYLAPAYIESLYVRTFYDTGGLGLLLLLLFLGLVLWPRREIQNSPGDLAPIARALTFGGLTLAVAYGVTDSTLLVWPWIMFGLIRAATWLAVRQARDLRGSARAGMGSGNGGNGGPSAPAPALGARSSSWMGNGSPAGNGWGLVPGR